MNPWLTISLDAVLQCFTTLFATRVVFLCCTMEVPNLVQELLRVSLIMRANQKFHKKLEPKIKNQTVFWQPWLDTEYSRKSDPKFSETFGLEPSSPESNFSNGVNTNGSALKQPHEIASSGGVDTPLDMSVRQRGLPPSYSQTINNPGYRSNYRPSVIHNGVPTREELPSGISMCDPIIDEHFRRSLGNDYHTLFQNNNVSKEQSAPKSPPKTPTTNVVELMDSTGLSVDDHFAKALGDTWAKLNKKDPEIKSNTSENSLVSI
ncbi:hypothetical protein NQ314_014489 [Rhamnusium bicolor]|uniref:Transcription cofactor vestigial-like protein 4 n=1 Tax=Rhamnusium bicolor TaxID=1586634 RepID=A0AAV8X1K0_9CUCU|nr:hypothetical protein NQ314_014489 [Rhamnusium bicolor]